MNQTQTTGSNQYGFYAVPKPVEPKKKYREDEYGQEYQQDQNEFEPIQDKEEMDEKTLQRDYYVDEAPFPEFKPKERGLDYGVQIQRGDLFDFDLEVQPLIEIMVGRSCVSAINELQQQKEKQERKQDLDKYQKKRNAELMVTQRLEAKHKRKNQQADRRVLQKQLFVKNQKETGKKIIARKGAKQCLLGLKNQLYHELEDAGYLREEPLCDLKVKYEEWLYFRILESLYLEEESMKAAEKLVKQQQNSIKQEHKKFIAAEQTKRQEQLDKRERIRKENEARKQKKRIKKMRNKLNEEREPDCIKFQELMEKYEQVNEIMKHEDVSSGFTSSESHRNSQSIYLSGGMDNFLLAYLENSGQTYSAQQIEKIIQKILKESSAQFSISLSAQNFQKLEQFKKKINENKRQFLKNKKSQIKQFIESIGLDLSLLESTKINIKSQLHNNFLQAIFEICLTVEPQAVEEDPFQMSSEDKNRLENVNKITINKEEESFAEKIKKVKSILRVRFGNTYKHQDEQNVKSQDEWIDIFDGEGWKKRKQDIVEAAKKEDQTAASYILNSFQESFVYDQRALYYFEKELEKLLDIKTGENFCKYKENLEYIGVELNKDIPVFDEQIKWT